jgi:hypothetical protein
MVLMEAESILELSIGVAFQLMNLIDVFGVM